MQEKMAKKKDWTLPFFRGQYMDECIGVIVDKLRSMGYYDNDNYDENKKEVEQKPADYTFELCLMFRQISKSLHPACNSYLKTLIL